MAGTVVADKWQNGDGTENFKCRAWVNFNGTGTVAIRASGNVSSITDNGGGNYTVNFLTAMPDANYSVSGTAGYNDPTSLGVTAPKAFSTNTLRFITVYANGLVADYMWVSISVFR